MKFRLTSTDALRSPLQIQPGHLNDFYLFLCTRERKHYTQTAAHKPPVFILHSATTPFYHFLMDQRIKDVSGPIWNTQPSRNLLLVHEATTAGSCHFMTCFKPSEFVSQLFPAVLAASYWNLFCSTISSAFRSKWKGFKLHSEIQSKKSSNFTPKSHWEHTNCSYHPNSLSLHFSGSHGGSWGSELSQDDPINMPDVFSLKKLKGTWLFY